MPETQGLESLPGILATIVETKTAELAQLRSDAERIEREAESAPPTRGFRDAVAVPGHVSLIAECKRRSPGAGEIRPGLDPAALTSGYERSGASALSVLTDSEYFGGSNDDLGAVKAATSIPVLRKDFTLDPLHVLEARAAGADAGAAHREDSERRRAGHPVSHRDRAGTGCARRGARRSGARAGGTIGRGRHRHQQS